jgi:hypothetical protein
MKQSRKWQQTARLGNPLPRSRSCNKGTGRGAAGGHTGRWWQRRGWGKRAATARRSQETAAQAQSLLGCGLRPSQSQGEEKAGPWRKGVVWPWTPAECGERHDVRPQSIMSARGVLACPRPRGVVGTQTHLIRFVVHRLPTLSCGSTISVTVRECTSVCTPVRLWPWDVNFTTPIYRRSSFSTLYS